MGIISGLMQLAATSYGSSAGTAANTQNVFGSKRTLFGLAPAPDQAGLAAPTNHYRSLTGFDGQSGANATASRSLFGSGILGTLLPATSPYNPGTTGGAQTDGTTSKAWLFSFARQGSGAAPDTTSDSTWGSSHFILQSMRNGTSTGNGRPKKDTGNTETDTSTQTPDRGTGTDTGSGEVGSSPAPEPPPENPNEPIRVTDLQTGGEDTGTDIGSGEVGSSPAPEPPPENPNEPIRVTDPQTGGEDTGTGTDGGTDGGIGTDAAGDGTGSIRPASEADAIQAGTVTSVTTGRVSTLSHDNTTGKEIASIQILSDVAEGHVTVNPDLSFALVLTETSHVGALSFSYQVTYADGSKGTFTADLKAVAGTQQAGWGLGDGYMLETGADGSVIVEHGDNHRKVYVSMSEDALSLKDIAAIEGLSIDKITTKFLMANPEYGSSPDMALKPDAGMKLWGAITGNGSEPSSNWLLFERGYAYSTGNLLESGTAGESALHPIYIGAWGDGDAPEILDSTRLTRFGNEHIVVQNVHFSDGFAVLRGTNILLDSLTMTGGETNIQNVTNFTLRNSDFIDVIREAPIGDYWAPHSSRISAIYVAATENIIIENNFFDHSGWAENYRYDLSLAGGQPPSMYSHNVYLQSTNEDITFRDNIVMRAAGTGTQVRSGGFVEDNVFIDNNGALLVGAGGMSDEKTFGYGNYSLVNGNLITSGAHKDAAQGIGSLTAGLTNQGYGATLIDNIVTHLANPADAAELAAKPIAHDSIQSQHATFFDNTIVYNWVGSKTPAAKSTNTQQQNIDGLSHAKLDATTIQTYAAKLLGKPTATIADLANYLRAQAEGKLDDVVDADVINAYFKVAFGLDTTIRGEETTLRFIPHELGDGVRWDNRLNWSTGDLPGVQDGDSVDLGGNWVRYSSATTTIENLDLGTGGKLTVTSGKLTVEGEIATGTTGGTLILDNAGQFWTEGYSDADHLTLDIDGGRFVNTGLFIGPASIYASDDAQVILATDKAAMDLRAGSKLVIEGSEAKVGFDGDDGMSLLRMQDGATLRFVATDGSFGTIEEFRSGAFDEEDDILSGIHLDGRLELDLTGLGTDATKWILASADEITDSFDKIVASGLGTTRDIRVTIDYDTDTVTLLVGAAGTGTGTVNSSVIGDEDGFVAGAGGAVLWDALHDTSGTTAINPIVATADDTQPSWML